MIAYFINNSTDLLVGNFTTNDVKVLYTLSSAPIVLHANADYLTCGLHDGKLLVWQLLNVTEFTDKVGPNWCVDINVTSPVSSLQGHFLESFATSANTKISQSFTSNHFKKDYNEIEKLCIEESFLFTICKSGRCVVLDINSGIVRCQFNTQLTNIIACVVLKFPRLHYHLLGVCTASQITFFMPEWVKSEKSKNYTDSYKDVSKKVTWNTTANVKNVKSDNIEEVNFTEDMRYVLHDILSVQETLSCISCLDKYIVAGTTSGVVIVFVYNILNKLANEICRIDLGYGVCSVQLYSSHNLIVINNARNLWKWSLEELECYTNLPENSLSGKDESNDKKVNRARTSNKYGDSICNVDNITNTNTSSNNSEEEDDNNSYNGKSGFCKYLHNMEKNEEFSNTNIIINNEQSGDEVELEQNFSDVNEEEEKEKPRKSSLGKSNEELIIYIDDIDDDADANENDNNINNKNEYTNDGDDDNRKKAHREKIECEKEKMELPYSNQMHERPSQQELETCEEEEYLEEEEKEEKLLTLKKQETLKESEELENARQIYTLDDHSLDKNYFPTEEIEKIRTAENALLSEDINVNSKEVKVEQSQVLREEECKHGLSKEPYEETMISKELTSTENNVNSCFESRLMTLSAGCEDIDTACSANEPLPRLTKFIVKSLDKLNKEDNTKLYAGPRVSSYKVNHLLETTKNGTFSHMHTLEESNEEFNSTTLLKEQEMQILKEMYDTEYNEEHAEVREIRYDNELGSKGTWQYSLHDEPFSCILEEIRGSNQESATGLTRTVNECSDIEYRRDNKNFDDNKKEQQNSTAYHNRVDENINDIASVEDDLMETTFGKVRYKRNTNTRKNLVAKKLLNIHNHDCDDILYNTNAFSDHILCGVKANNDIINSCKYDNINESTRVDKFTALSPFYLY